MSENQRLTKLLARIDAEQHSFAGRLYARLFELDAELVQLFDRSGLEMQGRMVIQALGCGVKSIDKPQDFDAIFRSIGRRHVGYGVDENRFALIGTAFVDTCRSSFGGDFDAATERDLVALFGRVNTAMREGAREMRGPQRRSKTMASAARAPEDPYLARFLENRPRRSRTVTLPRVDDIKERIEVSYLGEGSIETPPLQTILEASLANGVPHIHECGGRARCSTCRVMIVDGLDNCLPRTALEEKMAKRKGFYPEIRLACQTRLLGNVTLKRLVRDETDIEMAISGSIGDTGEEITGAVLFTDLWGFTRFAEAHLPYDVIHALNLLFRHLGQAVDRHDGYVDKYIGDNLMAIFGLRGESAEATCRNAVLAARDMLASLPAVNQYLRNYLGGEFRLGIGVAYGPMVTGELGFPLKRQFTAIGDTVNVAARLESETRARQADLLVSDSVVQNLQAELFELRSTHEFELKGKTKKVLAHEISVRP
jgi:class 3 adenylate cyclase/hemoglobin-like flavoprotein